MNFDRYGTANKCKHFYSRILFLQWWWSWIIINVLLYMCEWVFVYLYIYLSVCLPYVHEYCWSLLVSRSFCDNNHIGFVLAFFFVLLSHDKYIPIVCECRFCALKWYISSTLYVSSSSLIFVIFVQLNLYGWSINKLAICLSVSIFLYVFIFQFLLKMENNKIIYKEIIINFKINVTLKQQCMSKFATN